MYKISYIGKFGRFNLRPFSSTNCFFLINKIIEITSDRTFSGTLKGNSKPSGHDRNISSNTAIEKQKSLYNFPKGQEINKGGMIGKESVSFQRMGGFNNKKGLQQ